MLKHLIRKYGINPFDRLLKKASRNADKRFLICWNRGLGDIPLGLYALTQRILKFIPDAKMTYLTRADLAPGFEMLENVDVIVDPSWKRGTAFDLNTSLKNCGYSRSEFDVILEAPDPTRWLMWQLGTLTPKLNWNPTWDLLCERFLTSKDSKWIGVHVQTETQYAYEKNWPLAYWEDFFEKSYKNYGVKSLLFGFEKKPKIEAEGILDLRGETQLFEMLSLIKNRCDFLLVPDSGVLSIAYYLNSSFPLHVVSLWADPAQGVLKQNVASPNPLLKHIPLIAKKKDLRTVSVDHALVALFGENRE